MRHKRNSSRAERFARTAGTMLNLHPYSPVRTVLQRRHDWMVRKVIREEFIDAVREIYGRGLIRFLEKQRKARRLISKESRRRNR